MWFIRVSGFEWLRAKVAAAGNSDRNKRKTARETEGEEGRNTQLVHLLSILWYTLNNKNKCRLSKLFTCVLHTML